MLIRSQRRRAAVMIEVAIIVPVFVVLIAMAIDAVSGVVRYHQVATLARMGARYASVHAGQYAEEREANVVTATELKTNVIMNNSFGLQPQLLTCELTWLPNGNTYPFSVSSNTGTLKQNMVRVTVSYQWQPVFLFGRPFTLSSTSETAISY